MLKRRGAGVGINAGIIERLFSWLLVGGFIGAHLFAVLAYYPGQIAEDPWILLRVWEHLSSFGGMIGGEIALLLFMNKTTPGLSKSDRMQFLNLVAFVFPFALAMGRVGCAVVHDHPGRLTTIPVAVSLQSEASLRFVSVTFDPQSLSSLQSSTRNVGFHDLGLYELFFLVLVLIPVFLRIDKRAKKPPSFGMLFLLMYMPVRFLLDFLRIADATYAGLTPAQWMCAVALIGLAVSYLISRRSLIIADAGTN